MIALRTPVTVHGEPGTVVARGNGGASYHVRFADGRVRQCEGRHVRVAVEPVRLPVRPVLRLAVDNTGRV